MGPSTYNDVSNYFMQDLRLDVAVMVLEHEKKCGKMVMHMISGNV